MISIHPRLAAFIDAIFSYIIIWWFLNITSTWYIFIWFAMRIVWWGTLVNFVYYPPYINRYKHLFAIILGNIGITSLLIFSDPSNLLITKIISILVPSISFWLIPAHADNLSVMEKPHRRWKLFMSLLGVYGFWLAFFATTIFQIIQGYEILWGILGASLMVSLVSVWEWFEYGEKFTTKLILMAFLLFLILAETAGIVFLWPVGYFVGSFFLTWIWYVVWLLIRFSLTTTGIDWNKQRGFLVSNLIIMVLFLAFVVRWN